MVGGTVNLASRLEQKRRRAASVSFETYAHVKDEVRCEERGQVQVKGIAHPVATYAVLGPKQGADGGDTAHLRLELDAERMTDEERKAAADKLRRALGLLEKAAKPDVERWRACLLWLPAQLVDATQALNLSGLAPARYDVGTGRHKRDGQQAATN